MTSRADALPRKKFADVCLRPAKAELHTIADNQIYECVESVQRKYDQSEQQMAGLLGIAQSNYSRRTYNVARVQRLPEAMRQLFIEYFAKTVGLRVDAVTPQEQVKTAAKVAIVNLLDVMESRK